jgi:hypothetical protein
VDNRKERAMIAVARAPQPKPRARAQRPSLGMSPAPRRAPATGTPASRQRRCLAGIRIRVVGAAAAACAHRRPDRLDAVAAPACNRRYPEMPVPTCNEQHQPSCIAVPKRSALLVTDPASTGIEPVLVDRRSWERMLRRPIELRYLPPICTADHEQCCSIAGHSSLVRWLKRRPMAAASAAVGGRGFANRSRIS